MYLCTWDNQTVYNSISKHTYTYNPCCVDVTQLSGFLCTCMSTYNYRGEHT